MYWQFQGQNLLKVKSTSDIFPWVSTDETEYYFDINQPISVNSCFVYVDFQNELNREVIEIHRISLWWTRLHYYQYNREDCTKTHEIDSFVQINAVSQYFNTAMNNIDTLWRTRKTKNPWNKVIVMWGIVEDLDSQVINVWDKVLTLNEWANYVYYDYNSNEFAISATIPTEYDVVSLVTVTAGDVTNIQDLRAFKVRLKNWNVLKLFTESWWKLYRNWKEIVLL